MFPNALIRSLYFAKQQTRYLSNYLYWKKLLGNTDVVFLGPWLGEVGPELQYWIPFIQNLIKRDLFKKQKIIVVSRGGVEAWYANITSNYIDLFDHLSKGEFQKIRSEVLKNSQKQVKIHPMERLLIDNIAKHEKITSYTLIHPSFMWKTIV